MITTLIQIEHELGQAARAAIKIDASSADLLRKASGITAWHADNLTRITRFGVEGALELGYRDYIPFLTSEDSAVVEDNKISGSLIPGLEDLISIFPKLPPLMRQGKMPDREFQDLWKVFDVVFGWTLPDLVASAINHISFVMDFEPSRVICRYDKPSGKKALYYCPVCGESWHGRPEDGKCVCNTPSNLLCFYPDW